jgi:peptidyl-prolyl cis-trans isomerase D
MFDFVSKHKRLLQLILGLMIVPPFAFWGIQWTQRVGGAGEVAEVGGQKIGEQEFSEALRQQEDQLRGRLGRNFDPAMFDSPAMRREVLDGMISQRLLMQFAARNYMTVGKEELDGTITSIPAFQEDGHYSSERAKSLLAAQGISGEAFMNSVRSDLIVQQVSAALADSAIASKAAAEQFARLRAQEREVSEQKIQADARGVQIGADAVRAFYDANPARFQLPEEVQVEYIVLSADSLLAAEQADPGEAKKYYEANLLKYGEQEQRRASHILISVKPGASDDDKRKARARAESVLAKVRGSPGSFADLAKKESGDPGSASQGGDLGFFSRGMMVRPFEEAAFSLKPGEISGIVESDFGFHIIKVTGIKPGKMKTFEQVRPEIELMLRKQQAQRHFAEAAEAFSNIVYEQADSLKPAADKFHLAIQKAQGVTRQAAGVAVLNNPRLLAAVFSDDSIKNHRNTEAVETSPGTLVSARVTDHKAAALRAFDDVKDGIARLLAQQEAVARARKQGAALLEELRKGEASKASFGASRLVSRDDPKGLGAAAVSQVFAADASKLPAYAGLESADGYMLYRVSRVVDVQPDDTRQRGVQSELGRMNGTMEFKSFLDGLRADAKVEINREALERKVQ